jgi:copper transporter 1
MDQTNSSEVIMMTPYLHFSGGDHLYFRSWHPSSPGAIAGASIAIVILAISERLLHATRGVIDARWKRYGLLDYFDQSYFIVGSALSL